MAIRKSDLYSSIWASCDELRGGMDASQYKDYVLFMLFIKFITDKYGNSSDFVPPVIIPKGASFKDMIALKGKSDIGDKINTQGQIQEKTTQYLATLERHATDRVTVFAHDVESQLGKHEVPIGPEEARRLEEYECTVRGTLGSLAEVSGELELGQLQPAQGDAA